jgi:hypothetical protein
MANREYSLVARPFPARQTSQIDPKTKDIIAIAHNFQFLKYTFLLHHSRADLEISKLGSCLGHTPYLINDPIAEE